MREIKFRAWDTFYKMMLHSSYKDFSVLSEFFKELEDRKENECKVMQFTGLKDKNGVDIYEGDIIKTFHGSIYPVRDMIEFHLWIERKFSRPPQFEIIGNIYQNPELINQLKT